MSMELAVNAADRVADAGQRPAVAEIGDHPEVFAWFAEAKRLFAEAEERLGSGRLLPALSSLAAVPPLHRMLVQRCSEILDDSEDDVEDEPSSGMYL
jgi:hypothetical protein